MKKFLSLVILAAALAALSGCGGGQAPAAATAPAATTAPVTAPTTAPVAAPAATSAPTAAAAPTATTARASAPAATPAPVAKAAADTPEPTRAVTADLPVLRANALKSYVANISMTEESGSAQATPQPPANIEMRYSSEPAPGVYSWSSTGMAASGQADADFKMVQSGGVTYVFVPEQGKWLQMAGAGAGGMPEMGDVLDPNKIAQDAPQGLFARPNVVNAHETVDGVDTTHYKATEAQTQELFKDSSDQNRTFVSGTADFWVANSGGYLKQYLLTVTLKDQQNQQIKQTIKLTVTDENKPVTIATPPPDQVIDMNQYIQGMSTAVAPGK